MKNWKTSLGGFVVGSLMILGGFQSPTVDQYRPDIQKISGIAVAIWSLFQKDKDVTGGTRK